MATLHVAAADGDLELVKALVAAGQDPQQYDKNRLAPLHYASANDRAAVALWLIEQCHVDPEIRDMMQSTPLHHACRNGAMAVARYLVDVCHVDKEGRDWKEFTPLLLAVWAGQVEMAKFMVEAGADVEVKDQNGFNAVDWALKQHCPQVLAFFPASMTSNHHHHVANLDDIVYHGITD